jgi:hypothetical protein
MRTRLAALALLLAAAPAAAQTGTPPAGWRLLADRAGADSTALPVTAEGTALHFATGSISGVYWNPEHLAAGDYAVSASFTQQQAPRHPEGYGLFLMGSGLPGAEQTYWYFLVRGDGTYTIKHRAGAEVHTIQDWTASPAVRRADAQGKATNRLEVQVASDSLRFLANGQAVMAFPRSVAPSAEGLAGLRVNHGLDVRVEDFRVAPLQERK